MRTVRTTLTTLAWTLLSCWVALAENPAGTVLYVRSGSQVFLLLADHADGPSQDRGWAAFGGRPETGEQPAETAARETEEETRGYFPRDDLLRKLASREPAIDDNGFALFFVEVDFVPAQRIANNQPADLSPANKERGPYAWVPFSDIARHLGNAIDPGRRYPVDGRFLPPGCATRWYWDVWLASLRKALEDDDLPWDQ